MSLVDKISQMFGELVDKAIDQTQRSHSRSQSFAVDTPPTPNEVIARRQKIKDARLNARSAVMNYGDSTSRLRKAKAAHKKLVNAKTNNVSVTKLMRAQKAVEKAELRKDQAYNKKQKARIKLNQARRSLKDPVRITGTTKIPSKERRDAIAGKILDQVLPTKGMFGVNLSDVYGAKQGNVASQANMVGAGLAQMGQGLQGMGRSLKPDGTPGEAAGGVLRTASGALMSSGNPYAMAAGAALRLGEVLVKSVDNLREWNEGLHQANIKYAEFSSSMAVVEARQSVRDILYSRDRGEARSESAERLAQAKHKLNQAMAPIDDTWANMKNVMAASLAQILTPIVSLLAANLPELVKMTGPLIPILEWAAKKWGVKLDDAGDTTMGAYMEKAWEAYGNRKIPR